MRRTGRIEAITIPELFFGVRGRFFGLFREDMLQTG